MPDMIRYLIFTAEAAPEGQVIYVFQDSDGWYWLKKLIEHEGFQTPFTSIQEVELYLSMSLNLVKEVTPQKWQNEKE